MEDLYARQTAVDTCEDDSGSDGVWETTFRCSSGRLARMVQAVQGTSCDPVGATVIGKESFGLMCNALSLMHGQKRHARLRERRITMTCND